MTDKLTISQAVIETVKILHSELINRSCGALDHLVWDTYCLDALVVKMITHLSNIEGSGLPAYTWSNKPEATDLQSACGWSNTEQTTYSGKILKDTAQF